MKSKYVMYSNKIYNDISIMYDSDIHYVPGMKLDYLNFQLECLKKDPSTYYFLLGDLVNDSNINLNDLKEIRDILFKICKTKTKVFAILGNHDQVSKINSNGWQTYYNKNFVDMLRDIDGFNLLENESFRDENIIIHGTRFDSEFYDGEVHEPVDKYVYVMNNNLNYERDTFNILLDHSPYSVFNKSKFDLVPQLSSVDVVFSGHFHNGLIPYYIGRYLPGNFGLVSYKKLFQNNARGMKNITDNTIGFISAPVTTFAEHYGFLQKFNVLYPPVQQKVLIKKI